MLVRQRVLDLAEPVASFLDRELGAVGYIEAGNLDREGFGLEAFAVTGRAGRGGLEFCDLVARPLALGFAVAAIEIGDDAFERLLHFIAAQAVIIDKVDLFIACSVQDHIPDVFGEFVPGRVEVKIIVIGKGLQGLRLIGRGGTRPWSDGALGEGKVLVGDDQLRVDFGLFAETVTGRAGTKRIVERKEARFDLRNGEAGDGAGEIGRVSDPLRLGLAVLNVGIFENGDAIGETERCLEAFSEALLHAFTNDDPVHHNVNVVLELLVERRRVFEVMELAIDLDALEAVLQQLGELFFVLALAAPDHRSEQVKPGLFRQLHRAVDHFRHGLGLDGKAGGGRIGDADTRPEQAHIVVDLSDRADGGARIAAGRLLLDGDGGREALNAFHIGLLHQLKELACIGREALDIAALAFGIDRIEGER